MAGDQQVQRRQRPAMASQFSAQPAIDTAAGF
jgi:hypothetical protein